MSEELYKGMDQKRIDKIIAEYQQELREEKEKYETDMAQIREERTEPESNQKKSLDDREEGARKWFEGRRKYIEARIIDLKSKGKLRSTELEKYRGPKS